MARSTLSADDTHPPADTQPLTHKPCITCSLLLPLTSYARHSRRADGRASECRTCNTARVQAWRRAHPEWREKVDKAKARERQRRYRERLRELREDEELAHLLRLEQARRKALGVGQSTSVDSGTVYV